MARVRPIASVLILAPLVVADGRAAWPAVPGASLRWTDATPVAMIDDAVARATDAKSAPDARLAALAAIAALADRADDGAAEGAFERIAAAPAVPADVRDQATLLARAMAADVGTEAGRRADESLGVDTALSILGPFRDTGGGLVAHDGPESGPGGFGDMHARFSWGSYEVAWRAVPPSFATARGVPLDLFVFPRKESCTWLASALTVDAARTIVVRLAATGQVRLVFDGVDVGRGDDVHEGATFDRLAAKVHATAGAHWVAAKVCSGALDDEGRVRLRITDEAGARAPGVTTSADLGKTASHGARPPRPAFERVSTPLERAVAEGVERSSSIDARLDDAILRTLGGADDLRSPRAPGLLSSLTRPDAGLGADRTATAAWISPSAANRSDWLNRARADSSSDPGTRAFVDRRLVEQRAEAGLADWAMATLRGAAIDPAADSEAALIESEVDAKLGTDALLLGSVHRLAALARRQPKVPSAVLDELAKAAAPFDPALVAEVRQRLAARGEVGAERVLSAQARGARGVVEAARRAFEGGVADSDEAIAVARAVADAGDHQEARSLYERLARWAPNRAPVWAGLAQETSAGPDDALRDDATTAALRRARELDPGEVRYRAELALRTRTPPTADARDAEKYLVSSQTILARRQWTPRGHGGAADGPPDVADRQLHWLRAVVMHQDRRVSELVHYAREIVIAPRTEEELYEEVPAEGDSTEILRARVHRPDGSTSFPVEETDDSGRPRIRWPELSPGDVVEVAFRSWTAGPVGGRGDPPFYRLDYAGSLSTHPVVYNEVDVESPKDAAIYADVVNGKADRREEHDEGGTHVLRLVWDKPINVPDEPLAPALSEIVPTVVLSTFKDWSAFRAWYAEAVHGFTEPDAQVRELAATLTRGKTSRQDKLRALFEFVADDIRYVNYVSGEWWLPNRPQQLLARREGDCDDKAILLITLLRAAGIDAQEVMVQTRLTGQPSILRARGAAAPLFDHGIAFLPGPAGGTYLDATSPQSRLGPLPSMDARAVALRMDGPADVVELPSSSPDDHGVDATWTITLDADGAASLEGVERATGDDAFWMRSYLTEPGARAQWMEDHLVGAWFPTVEVDKKVDFQGDLAHGAATASWKARSSGLARREGDELVVPLSPPQTLASQLAPLVQRTLPVVLPPQVAPRKESRTIRVVAPKGWKIEALPEGGAEDGGAFGRARLELGRDPRDPNAAVIKRTVVFDESAIPLDEYPKWRAWIVRVDALLRKSVRFAAARGAR